MQAILIVRREILKNNCHQNAARALPTIFGSGPTVRTVIKSLAMLLPPKKTWTEMA